jgi:hypothetical protein
MKTKTTVLALLLCAFAVGFAPMSRAAEEFKGNWTIMPSKQPGQVLFGLIHQSDGHNSQSQSDWPAGEFLGLDLSVAGKRDVTFNISRDAGRFDCEGYLKDGEGAGIFHFTPDAQYPKDMKALGFDGVDDEMQFAMAVHDVSLDFARTMKNEKLSGLTTEMLMAFRIHGVTPQFIREIRAAGLKAEDSDRLVAFRIHGVTPQMVNEVRKSGLTVSEDELIAFRIHGVTPEYINDLKSKGLKNLTVDQLVNLRIHGID